MFKFDYIFEKLKLSITFNCKRSINSVADIVSYTLDFNTKLIKKHQLTVEKGAGCCIYPFDVTSSVV